MSHLKSISHIFTLSLKPALNATLVFVVQFFIAQQSLAAKDLFNNPPHAHNNHSSPAQQMVAPPAEETEAEPALSSTDAAVRAQRHVDGQVMNVRRFRDDDKTLYGVKVLQKNGRMRTVNVDANSGAIIE